MQIIKIQPPFKRYQNYSKISFGESRSEKQSVQEVDYEEYKSELMTDTTKKRLRKRYNDFSENRVVNKEELVDSKYEYLPLRSEKSMDNFIDIVKIYSQYKDQQIICLGRSPKWFLNASLWMEGGINDYKFLAFSGFWYRPDPREGIRRVDRAAPKPENIEAYRRYLKHKRLDPLSIVKNRQETGKKTVITDYIHSGKGACSFLEIMGDFAKDQGVLEEFSKSIQIVGIGSRDYLEEMNPFAESFSTPYVPMPDVLLPYESNIKQEFYNMDYNVFCEMLLNQNANECRSTYYPSNVWSIYNPDRFKIGMIKCINKIKTLMDNKNIKYIEKLDEETSV